MIRRRKCGSIRQLRVLGRIIDLLDANKKTISRINEIWFYNPGSNENRLTTDEVTALKHWQHPIIHRTVLSSS